MREEFVSSPMRSDATLMASKYAASIIGNGTVLGKEI